MYVCTLNLFESQCNIKYIKDGNHFGLCLLVVPSDMFGAPYGSIPIHHWSDGSCHLKATMHDTYTAYCHRSNIFLFLVLLQLRFILFTSLSKTKHQVDNERWSTILIIIWIGFSLCFFRFQTLCSCNFVDIYFNNLSTHMAR